jgi:hypothetical protein
MSGPDDEPAPTEPSDRGVEYVPVVKISLEIPDGVELTITVNGIDLLMGTGDND